MNTETSTKVMLMCFTIPFMVIKLIGRLHTTALERVCVILTKNIHIKHAIGISLLSNLSTKCMFQVTSLNK